QYQRIDDEPGLLADPLHAGQGGGTQQQVQPLEVGVGAELGPLQLELQRPAEPLVQLAQRVDGQQVVLPGGLDPLDADEVQDGLEVTQDGARLLAVDHLGTQELFLLPGQGQFSHRRASPGLNAGETVQGEYTRSAPQPAPAVPARGAQGTLAGTA